MIGTTPLFLHGSRRVPAGEFLEYDKYEKCQNRTRRRSASLEYNNNNTCVTVVTINLEKYKRTVTCALRCPHITRVILVSVVEPRGVSMVRGYYVGTNKVIRINILCVYSNSNGVMCVTWPCLCRNEYRNIPYTPYWIRKYN